MKIKICGLKTPEALTAAIKSGADFAGLVFHPASPRHLDYETARYLRAYIPPSVKTVALLVDPDDAAIDRALAAARPDFLQLHGNETPQHIAAIRARSKTPVIKAFRISGPEYLQQIPAYESIADWLLFDAQTPGGGKAFDWSLLQGKKFTRPWMLAGGLTPGNVADAVKMLRPDAVDVSSGVESAPGVKDPAKIAAFIKAARSL